MRDLASIARAAFEAYAESDREKLERVLHEDFSFSSPLDNRLDRATYFERCWPNHRWIAAFDFRSIVAADDQVYVTYEATRSDGKRFKNTERITLRNGLIAEVEVYFGWPLPHPAAEGDFVERSRSP